MNTNSASFARDRVWRVVMCAALWLALAGCVTEPQRPTSSVAVPDQWQEVVASGAVRGGAAPWWQAFRDAQLDALIAQALSAQPDLRVVSARVAQARAQADAAHAEALPQLGARAQVRDGRGSATDPKAQAVSGGLEATWEPDIVGRLSLAEKAAQADRQGAEWALRAARSALVAEVSRVYGDWVTLQRQTDLAQAHVATSQRLVEVAQRKFEAGGGPVVDVDRRRAQLAADRAAAHRLDGEARLRLRQLGLLAGSPRPPALDVDVALTCVPDAPTPMLPAELLERRPEVQQKVVALDAALARLGVARRDVYPRLQIDWSGRRERISGQGAQLMPQWVVATGVSLTMPLFDGGRIRANVAIHEAAAAEAMAEYEKALIAALVEGESALAAWAAATATAQQWALANQATISAERNVSRLFDAGMVDASVVLDAHQEVLTSQNAYLQATGARWSAAVTLRHAFEGSLDADQVLPLRVE